MSRHPELWIRKSETSLTTYISHTERSSITEALPQTSPSDNGAIAPDRLIILTEVSLDPVTTTAATKPAKVTSVSTVEDSDKVSIDELRMPQACCHNTI
ncbi:unnamed protein product [Euphydryas editha]|uniref:Uncharacterized protein n=1 Tax=Euphydryas editha TaxID=104508 RepID=A0AAU9TA87_EUPED|nr:unnamed protein product [Euphydryas editha]